MDKSFGLVSGIGFPAFDFTRGSRQSIHYFGGTLVQFWSSVEGSLVESRRWTESLSIETQNVVGDFHRGVLNRAGQFLLRDFEYCPAH